MVSSRTNVVGSEAMVGPGLALEGRDMGDAKLAYGMQGVGKEIHGKAVHTVVGGAGGVGLPGPLAVGTRRCQRSGGEETLHVAREDVMCFFTVCIVLSAGLVR